MKIFKLLVACLVCTATCFAQDEKLISDTAFSRMIVQDITYAIAGENAPVSGLKVDISKPEGTISGMFPIKNHHIPWDIFSFELKGGVTDKNFSFLKGGNSANSAFELRPSFHRITWFNSAKYGKRSENGPRKKILFAKNELTAAKATRLIDTFYVVTSLYNHHLQMLNDAKSLPSGINTVTSSHEKIAAHFIAKIINNSNLVIDSNDVWNSVLLNLPKAKEDTAGRIQVNTFYNEVVGFYDRYKKLYDGLDENTLDEIILNASGLWTQKKYFWWTLSPFVRTEKVNEYHSIYEGRDSSHFKSDYRWYYGVALNANRYWVTPNKVAVLLRGTLSLAHNNNLSTLSSFSYETRNPFFQNGSSITERTKNGSAYNNEDIKTGFEKQFSTELYILPLTSFFPGFYASANISHSDLYKLPNVVDRDNDKVKIGGESGLVFNINNRDKNGSILSIITYFRYEDFTDNRRTSTRTGIPESINDFQQRNISIGVKVGIPITLPKRDG